MRPRIAFNAPENLQMLFTRSWDGDYEPAVFLGNEVFARAGRAAVGVLLFDLDA